MESKRELNKRQCRDRILKASAKLFKSKGYDETLISDVAERAGVSRATLYNYFPSKESLLLGLAQQQVHKLDKLKAGMKDQPAMEQMRRLMVALVQDDMKKRGLAQKRILLCAQPDSFLQGPHTALLDIFGELCAKAQKEGALRGNVPVAAVVELVYSVYLTSMLYWKEADCTDEEACEARVRTLLDGVLTCVAADADAAA